MVNENYIETLIENVGPLLSCPFCSNDLNVQDPMDTIYPIDRERRIWNIVCGVCTATKFGGSAEHCVKSWNKRSYDG